MAPVTEIEYSSGDRVADVHFDLGERNTFTLAGFEAIAAAAEVALANRSVRCIVFASDVRGYFSDGFALADLFGSAAHTEAAARDYSHYDAVVRQFERLLRIPVPTIAFVDGLCRGAGFEFAMAADFLVATANSSFGLHEVRLGIVPGLGGAGFLQDRVRSSIGRYRLLSGDIVSFEFAQEHDMIDLAVASLAEAHEQFVRPLARRTRAALVRTKGWLGHQETKLRHLADCREGFLSSLSDRLLRHDTQELEDFP